MLQNVLEDMERIVNIKKEIVNTENAYGEGSFHYDDKESPSTEGTKENVKISSTNITTSLAGLNFAIKQEVKEATNNLQKEIDQMDCIPKNNCNSDEKNTPEKESMQNRLSAVSNEENNEVLPMIGSDKVSTRLGENYHNCNSDDKITPVKENMQNSLPALSNEENNEDFTLPDGDKVNTRLGENYQVKLEPSIVFTIVSKFPESEGHKTCSDIENVRTENGSSEVDVSHIDKKDLELNQYEYLKMSETYLNSLSTTVEPRQKLFKICSRIHEKESGAELLISKYCTVRPKLIKPVQGLDLNCKWKDLDEVAAESVLGRNLKNSKSKIDSYPGKLCIPSKSSFETSKNTSARFMTAKPADDTSVVTLNTDRMETLKMNLSRRKEAGWLDISVDKAFGHSKKSVNENQIVNAENSSVSFKTFAHNVNDAEKRRQVSHVKQSMTLKGKGSGISEKVNSLLTEKINDTFSNHKICSTINETKTDKQLKYLCHCGKPFDKKNDYLDHIREDHWRPKEFTCEECKQSYRKWRDYSRHKCGDSNNKNAFTCSVCDRSFQSEGILRNHTSIGKKKCKDCDKVFCYVEDLNSHKKTHLKYSCSVCLKKFYSRWSLSMHMRNEHTSLKCKQCNKGFMHSNHLKIHIAHQHGNGKFKCDGCDKNFVSKILYKNHKRKCTKTPYTIENENTVGEETANHLNSNTDQRYQDKTKTSTRSTFEEGYENSRKDVLEADGIDYFNRTGERLHENSKKLIISNALFQKNDQHHRLRWKRKTGKEKEKVKKYLTRKIETITSELKKDHLDKGSVKQKINIMKSKLQSITKKMKARQKLTTAVTESIQRTESSHYKGSKLDQNIAVRINNDHSDEDRNNTIECKNINDVIIIQSSSESDDDTDNRSHRKSVSYVNLEETVGNESNEMNSESNLKENFYTNQEEIKPVRDVKEHFSPKGDIQNIDDDIENRSPKKLDSYVHLESDSESNEINSVSNFTKNRENSKEELKPVEKHFLFKDAIQNFSKKETNLKDVDVNKENNMHRTQKNNSKMDIDFCSKRKRELTMNTEETTNIKLKRVSVVLIDIFSKKDVDVVAKYLSNDNTELKIHEKEVVNGSDKNKTDGKLSGAALSINTLNNGNFSTGSCKLSNNEFICDEFDNAASTDDELSSESASDDDSEGYEECTMEEVAAMYNCAKN